MPPSKFIIKCDHIGSLHCTVTKTYLYIKWIRWSSVTNYLQTSWSRKWILKHSILLISNLIYFLFFVTVKSKQCSLKWLYTNSNYNFQQRLHIICIFWYIAYFYFTLIKKTDEPFHLCVKRPLFRLSIPLSDKHMTNLLRTHILFCFTSFGWLWVCRYFRFRDVNENDFSGMKVVASMPSLSTLLPPLLGKELKV